MNAQPKMYSSGQDGISSDEDCSSAASSALASTYDAHGMGLWATSGSCPTGRELSE